MSNGCSEDERNVNPTTDMHYGEDVDTVYFLPPTYRRAKLTGVLASWWSLVVLPLNRNDIYCIEVRRTNYHASEDMRIRWIWCDGRCDTC
jgi:hypothetical protein